MLRRMKSPLAAILLVLACCSLARAGAAAAENPSAASYDFEVAQDAVGKSCRVALTLVAAPQTIAFRLIYTYDKQQEVTLVGFSLNLAELAAAGPRPAAARVIALDAAALVAPSFDSRTQLNGGPVEDGGVALGTVNEEIANALVDAFFAGNFDLVYATHEPQASRSYHVAEPPPDDMRQQWAACTKGAQ